MDSDEMFNWPDGDVILRATRTEKGPTMDRTDECDFRVHKAILSISSPIFKEMFKNPQSPLPALDGADVVKVTDPPRALELILRLIYPSETSPVIDDLTILSEALILADKYDIKVARSRLRSSFMEFTKTEPLRAYAIASRLGLEDEMKAASSHTTSIHLPGLSELPEEFKSIPATEYHRLILLHSRYRKQAQDLAARSPLLGPPDMPHDMESVNWKAVWENFVAGIGEGTPLDVRSLTLLLKAEAAGEVSETNIELHVSSILSQADTLNLTI